MTYEILFKDIETRYKNCKGVERYTEIRNLLENTNEDLFLAVKAHCTTQIFNKDFIPYIIAFASLCISSVGVLFKEKLSDITVVIVYAVMSSIILITLVNSIYKMMNYTPKHKYLISIIEDIIKDREKNNKI